MGEGRKGEWVICVLYVLVNLVVDFLHDILRLANQGFVDASLIQVGTEWCKHLLYVVPVDEIISICLSDMH